MEFSTRGNTGSLSRCGAQRLKVTSSMAAEVLCLLFKEHCVISNPATSSADCLTAAAEEWEIILMDDVCRINVCVCCCCCRWV